MAKAFVVGDRALELLKRISFPRVSGSLEEKKAAEILAAEITNIGFEVKKEGFTITRKYPVKAELSITGPEQKEYTVTGLINAGATPKEGLEADFIRIEYIDESSLKRVKDKFVLLNEQPKEKEYEQLVNAGIAGLLILNGTIRDTPDNSDLDTLRFRDNWLKYGTVPAFAIRMYDALDLLKRSPEKVRFCLQLEERTTISQNLVVTVPGTEFPEEHLAIGAHYDSTEFSFGAWDNGAGVVQVVEVLRYLKDHSPKRTVHAIFFGSEEIGLKGSKAFLEAHAELWGSLIGMVNIDVGGSFLGHDMFVVTAGDDGVKYVEGLLKEAGHSAVVRQDIMSTDSSNFADYGIPTISVGRHAPRGGGFMHTRYDKIDFISAEVLDDEIGFLTFLFDRLCNAFVFPVRREIPDDLKEKLKKYFGTGLSSTEQAVG